MNLMIRLIRYMHFVICAKNLTANNLLSSFIDERPYSDEFDIHIKRFISRNKSKSLHSDPKVYKYPKPSKNIQYLKLGDLPSFYDIDFRVVRVKITSYSYKCLITNLPDWPFPPTRLKEIYHMR